MSLIPRRSQPVSTARPATELYSKREMIILELIMELAEEGGSKRSTRIKALDNYGSKQDRYLLLKKLVEKDRILEKHQYSHKNVEYSLSFDRQLIDFIKMILKSHRSDLEEIESAAKLHPALDDREATAYRISTILLQLSRILQAAEAIAYYEAYDDRTKGFLKLLIHRELDHMLMILQALNQTAKEPTGRALKIASSILTRRALKHGVK